MNENGILYVHQAAKYRAFFPGDFLISRSLSDSLADPAKLLSLTAVTPRGNFIVVPAFEIDIRSSMSERNMTPEQALQLGVQRAKAVSEGSKGQLLNALPEGWLSPFGFWKNRTQGHGQTDYAR